MCRDTRKEQRQKEDGRAEVKIMPKEVKCHQQFATWLPVWSRTGVHIQLIYQQLITIPQDTLPSSLSVFTRMAKLIRDGPHYEGPLSPSSFQSLLPHTKRVCDRRRGREEEEEGPSGMRA